MTRDCCRAILRLLHLNEGSTVSAVGDYVIDVLDVVRVFGRDGPELTAALDEVQRVLS